MDEDLYTRFLPQFIPVARARVATALAAARRRDHSANMTIVRELHTLAGEAGLLGLGELVPVARNCENKAKLLDISGNDQDAEQLLVALQELERMVEGIVASAAQTAE
jgi:HPt (histidine-containing phosphotransfer) domain-containing protein